MLFFERNSLGAEMLQTFIYTFVHQLYIPVLWLLFLKFVVHLSKSEHNTLQLEICMMITMLPQADIVFPLIKNHI